MGRIKQLTDMEIDEISLVDRPANAHARVVISKRAGEEDMPEDIYDEDGDLVDEVEVGDIVFDEYGDPFLVVDGDYEDFAYDEEDEFEEVGKSRVSTAQSLMGAGKPGGVSGMGRGSRKTSEAIGDLPKPPSAADTSFRTTNSTSALGRGSTSQPKAPSAGGNKKAANTTEEAAGDQTHWQRNKNKYLVGGAVTTAAAGGYGMSQLNKSFSDELREELSKSLTDIERDEVISKAFSQVEEMAESLAEAEEIAKSERDLRLLAEYEEVAKSYNVPVDPAELAPVLYTIAEVLPYEYGEVIHKALSAAGAMIFEEVGFEGAAANNDVLYAVDQFIEENVEKSDISKAEAVSAVFDANPDAYDQYMATRYL